MKDCGVIRTFRGVGFRFRNRIFNIGEGDFSFRFRFLFTIFIRYLCMFVFFLLPDFLCADPLR